MTAANDMSGLKAAYNAAGGAKDRFGFIDIGLNPETRLPLGERPNRLDRARLRCIGLW